MDKSIWYRTFTTVAVIVLSDYLWAKVIEYADVSGHSEQTIYVYINKQNKSSNNDSETSKLVPTLLAGEYDTKSGLRKRTRFLTSSGNILAISQLISMFYHSLESYRRDDSNEWYNIEIGWETKVLELPLWILAGPL